MTDISQQVLPQLVKYCCDLNEFKFGEKIGEGGFGEVFFAIHQPTGTKSAVKKLFLKKMEGDDLVLFRRELENLAVCDNMFILPFLGCTLTYPFTIITKLIPNGSLFNALKHKKNAPGLTGTEKTIIAFGIAHGMAYLHKHRIMHRDLKSLNILLDEKLYPIICDFGLSRKEDEGEAEGSSQFATKDVGTPHWMAPEMFDSTIYSNKVDVYSYGMLLWEMLAESAPFKNMNAVQIGYAVCKKHERPKFPEDAPKLLKKLISHCWKQDPDQRPTFDEIVKLLKDVQQLYAGTDKHAVAQFIKLVEADEKTRCKPGEWKKPPLAPLPGTPKKQMGGSPLGYPQKMSMGSSPMMSQPMVMGGSPMMSQPLQQMSPAGSIIASQPNLLGSMQHRMIPQPQSQPMMARPTHVNYVILSHPERQDFLEVFNAAISIINVQNAPEFFSNLKQACKDSTPPQLFLQFLTQVSQIAQSDVNICQCLVQSGFHYFLPYTLSGLSTISFIILNTVVLAFPQAINTDLLKILGPTVQSNCQNLVDIFILYFRNGDHFSNHAEVFDFILNNAEAFVNNTGVYFLTFYYNVFSNYPTNWQNRHSDIPKVLSKAFISQDSKVIAAAYKFAIEYIDQKIQIDPLDLSIHLKNPATRYLVSSYLARQQSVEYTRELVDALIEASQEEKLALVCLYKSLQDSATAASLATSSSVLWSKTNKLTIVDKLSITLMLVAKEENYNALANSDGFCGFLADIPHTGNAELIDIASEIVIKLQATQPFVQTLMRSGFFHNYLNAVPYLGSQNAIIKSLYMIYTIGSSTFVEDFMLYKGYLMQMLNMNNEYTPSALSVLAVLTTYPEPTATFKQMNLVNILNGISNVPNYQVYIQAIMANLNP